MTQKHNQSAPARQTPKPATTSTQLFTCFTASAGPAGRAVTAVQDDIVKDIEEQTNNSSAEDQQWLLCLLGVDVPFDGFNQDAEHERHGEDGVAEGAHHVCPEEAKRALPVPVDTAGLHAQPRNDHGHKVGEDGERIGGQREGVAYVGDDQLHHEHEDAHRAQED